MSLREREKEKPRDKGKPGNSGVIEAKAMKERVLYLAETHEYLLSVRVA